MPFPIALAAVALGAAAIGAFALSQKKGQAPPPPPLPGKPRVTPQGVPQGTRTPGFAPTKPPFTTSPVSVQPAPTFAPEPATPFVPAPAPAPAFRPAASGTINRSSSEYGKWLQAALNQIDQAGLAVDGAVGPKTKAAVRAYQGKRGLTVDGISGPQTEAALMKDGAPNPPGFTGLRPEATPKIVDLDVAAADAALQQALNSPEGNVIRNVVTSADAVSPIPAAIRSTIGYRKWVQASLNSVDPPSPLLAVDGAIGPKSQAAIRHFQGQSGIAATGQPNAATDAALITANIGAGVGAIRPPGA